MLVFAEKNGGNKRPAGPIPQLTRALPAGVQESVGFNQISLSHSQAAMTTLLWTLLVAVSECCLLSCLLSD